MTLHRDLAFEVLAAGDHGVRWREDVPHFHVHDAKDLLDETGIDLPDVPAARDEALRLAGAMLLDDASMIHSKAEWHLSVTDASGASLLLVNIRIISPSSTH